MSRVRHLQHVPHLALAWEGQRRLAANPCPPTAAQVVSPWSRPMALDSWAYLRLDAGAGRRPRHHRWPSSVARISTIARPGWADPYSLPRSVSCFSSPFPWRCSTLTCARSDRPWASPWSPVSWGYRDWWHRRHCQQDGGGCAQFWMRITSCDGIADLRLRWPWPWSCMWSPWPFTIRRASST